LILFIDPDQERLLIIMENSSVVGPVPIQTACLKESITLLEKEVVFNELLFFSLCQRGEGIVLSCKFTLET
jgi:hypothetical protein